MDGAKIYSDVTKKNMIIMTEQWVLFIPLFSNAKFK